MEELREWLTSRDFRERYKLASSTLSELARQGRVDVLDLGAGSGAIGSTGQHSMAGRKSHADGHQKMPKVDKGNPAVTSEGAVGLR